MSETKKIIFVGGVHRSGTTMVQRILNSHPDIYGGTEFDRLKDIIYLRSLFHKSIDDGRISNFFNKSKFDEKLSYFIQDLLSDILERSDKKIISEKTPSNTLVFNELIEVCPEAKFLFIIRDPKAIYASMKEVKSKAIEQNHNVPLFARNVGEGVEFINKFWKKGFEAMENHPDKILLIKYEDIILNSEPTLKLICKHIGVDFNERMLSPNDSKFERFTKNDNIFYDKNKLNRNIDSSGINKWEKKLTNFEKAYINMFINYNSSLIDYKVVLKYNPFILANVYVYNKMKLGLSNLKDIVKKVIR